MNNRKIYISSSQYGMLKESEWNFHFGKNHNGEPYYSDNKRQMGGRETGHFGSGTYFSTFKDETPDTDEKYGDNLGDDRPQFIKVGENVYRVDMDFYKNLYRVYTRKQGNVLFTLLKHLNSMYYIVQYGSDTSTLSQYYQIVVRNAKALIAYAGIDAPPYQSGKFTGTDRHISKRGSSTLRKVGFETMTCLVMQKKCGDPVYDFIKKKQAEGKACKVAKIAGFNKFLRIYYARVMEVYQ